MKFTDLFSGMLGAVFAYSMTLVILMLMLLISLRLLLSRRKKGYLSITLAVLTLIADYILMIYAALYEAEGGLIPYFTLLLKVVSFLLLNLGTFQLYNVTRARHKLLFFSLLLLSGAVSAAYFYTPSLVEASGYQMLLLQNLWMELYLYVLIFLSFTTIPSRIAQSGKFQAALTLYFCAHTAHMVNAYMFTGKQPFYSFLEHMLPLLYFTVFFLLLFDRIIELMQAIYQSSITDGLTRLYNRKYFDSKLSQCIRMQLPVSVIFSDIDNFKKLNDTKGHDMGDKVLKHVAEIIKEEAEDYGLCGRYGGEEMVVLITGDDSDAGELAERMRARIEAETIATVSMGYSKYKKGMTAEELIKQADEAMYSAKQTGKNKVVKYAKAMPKAATY